MLNSISFEKIKIYFDKHCLKMLMLLTVILSALSYIWSYQNGYSLAYNDVMSHLNISRLVFDSIEPNFAQLGSVWLPLSHVLPLLLIWNDWAWHSGFAGSIFSMIAYVISVWGIYNIIKDVTKNKIASFLGGCVFAVNLNMLYLQTTSLTEPLYLVFFILSVLCFLKWITKDNSNYLFLLGLLGFLQVLTRYDGWFVVGIEFFLILYYEIIYNRRKFKQAIGKIIIFTFPVIFGVGLWFLWNFLIYGDPLYFAFGPYSARAQQANIESNAGLIMKGNLGISFMAYWYDILAVVGKYIVILFFAGLASFFLQKKLKIDFSKKILVIIFLISPVVFNIIALYLGFSIINLPELGWNPSGEFSGQWFNTRYGIFALPLVAFFIGIFSNFRKIFIPIMVVVIILFQGIITYNNGIITLIDGTVGSSSFANNDISFELKKTVQENEKVIISTSFFNSVLFKSGFHLEQFIHEGVSKQWPYAIVEPEEYAKWIVMANGDVKEPVYDSLIKKQKNIFLNFYKLSYRGKHTNIYKAREENEIFVLENKNNLMIGKNPFIIKGVNFYDLAYKTDQEIIDTFDRFKKNEVNTVRFWMFGDGFVSGFQPQSGIINEERFKKTDLIIAIAKKNNIKLIPALVNNFDDYGGKKQYLKWTGNSISNEDLFYSEEEIKKLFKNYINHVISRKNSITNSKYSEEASILAWEIINEPKISKGKQQVLVNWGKDITEYIKQIDQNHLVYAGTKQLKLKIESGEEKNAVSKILPIEEISTPVISDGDLIRNFNAQNIARFDIYEVKIIGDKKFKRLILNPYVFESYGYLKWENVKSVDQLTFNSFAISDLAYFASDDRIYKLYPKEDTGQKRLIKNSAVLARLGYDADSIYEINQTDKNSYATEKDLE